LIAQKKIGGRTGPNAEVIIEHSYKKLTAKERLPEIQKDTGSWGIVSETVVVMKMEEAGRQVARQILDHVIMSSLRGQVPRSPGEGSPGRQVGRYW